MDAVDIFVIQPCSIHKQPYRHIRVKRALLLIDVKHVGNDERDVILHAHADHAAHSSNLDIVRVIVARSVNRVVKGKSPVLMVAVSKQEAEQPVLVLTVDISHTGVSAYCNSYPYYKRSQFP